MCHAAAIRMLTGCLLSALCFQRVLAQPARDTLERDAFVAWARSAATPLAWPAERTAGSAADPSRLGGFTDATRVVAIGESAHGTRELMMLKAHFTDRLIRSRRVSAVVLESGLVEARAVDAWITHQTDSTPDFAQALSYGWGRQSETIEALRHIRDYNARVPVERRVRFYGMDLPANGGGSLIPALEWAWSYLDDVDPRFVARSRATLKPIAATLHSDGYGIIGKYASLGPGRDTLRVQLDSLVGHLRANERSFASRTSRERYAWTLRVAEVARQTEAALRIGWNDASNPRDSAMADNVRWVVEREGARGLVVIWAHDLHVARAPITGPLYASRRGASSVVSMGERLGRSLGSAYLPIGTAFRRHAADAARMLDSSSIDGALSRVGMPYHVLDLARAPRTGPVARWLDATRLKRAEDGYVVTNVRRAFDAIVYLDSIGPSRPVQQP